MNLAVSLERLEQLCEQPSAVRRFREVILESAIRGRLSDQCTHDQPATELLRTITAARLSESKRYVSSPPLTDAESWFQLPHGWVWTRLGEIGRLFNGDSVSEAGKTELAKVGAGLPFIATKDIGYGSETIAYENGLKVKPGDTRFKVAKANSVLICAEGGSAGRKIALTDRDICFGNKLYANETWNGVDPRFVYYVYQAPSFYRAFVAKMTGIIGGISRSELLSLPFPLPPSAEQKRIVAKVDELTALCDRLEAQLQERDARSADLSKAALAKFSEKPTVENLEYLFQTTSPSSPSALRDVIMRLAASGRLVKPEPDCESASQCLDRLALSPSLPSDASTHVASYAVPSNWARVRFEDVAVVSGGVTLGRKQVVGKLVTLPYLRVANVKRGRLDLKTLKELAIGEYEIERYALRENDLLLTEGGDWDKVGRAVVWRGELPLCLHQNHVFRARMRSPEFVPSWFELYFNSPDGRRYFESASKQTTNLASINMRQVRDCPVPFPPPREQRRIVAKVEELMALVDQLEAQLAASEEVGMKLLDALVAELAPSN